jgi:hypothetical protein
LHLPTTIKQIRINPALLGATDRTDNEFVPVDSSIADREAGQRGITGNVDLYSSKGSNAAIQVQRANFMPLGGSAAAEDRRVFSKVHWVGSHVNGDLAARDIPMGDKHVQMVMLLERIATFYLRQFDKLVAKDDPLRSEFPTNWYLNYARYVTDMVETGRHKWAQKEWLNDTLDDILELSKPWSDTPDVQIMHLTGAQMPRVFKGETTILEQFRANDLLDRYYAGGFGLSESAQWVSRAVKQIVDRYPHMNVMEIGTFSILLTRPVHWVCFWSQTNFIKVPELVVLPKPSSEKLATLSAPTLTRTSLLLSLRTLRLSSQSKEIEWCSRHLMQRRNLCSKASWRVLTI